MPLPIVVRIARLIPKVHGTTNRIHILSHVISLYELPVLAAAGDSPANARRDEVFGALRRTPPAVIVLDQRMIDDDPSGDLQLNPERVPELQSLLDEHYQQMDQSVLRPYPGGQRERVYVRSAELCGRMPGCRLS